MRLLVAAWFYERSSGYVSHIWSALNVGNENVGYSQGLLTVANINDYQFSIWRNDCLEHGHQVTL
jgi:hypothetical protein